MHPVVSTCLPPRTPVGFSPPLQQTDHLWLPSSTIVCSCSSLVFSVTGYANKTAIIYHVVRGASKLMPRSRQLSYHGLPLSNRPCVRGTHVRPQFWHCVGQPSLTAHGRNNKVIYRETCESVHVQRPGTLPYTTIAHASSTIACSCYLLSTKLSVPPARTWRRTVHASA